MGTEGENEGGVRHEEKNSAAASIKYSDFIFLRMCFGKGRSNVSFVF